MKATTRKLIALVLGIVMLLSLFTFTAAAVDEGGPMKNTDGTIGEDIYWRIFNDHGEWALEIYGDGRIPDYASPDETPWAAYRSGIGYIAIEKASYIGKNAFAGFSILDSVIFYGDAPGFGDSAFSDVSAICYVDFNNETWIDYVQQDYGGEIDWATFNSPEDEDFRGICGDGVIWILFYGDYLMIHGKGEMYDYKSSADTPWAKYRNKIIDIRVDEGITKIGDYAFADIKFCDTISFLGDAPKFGENSFKNTSIFANYNTRKAGWDEDVLQNYGGEISWSGGADAEFVEEGMCGEDAGWQYYDNGLLEITGGGAMYNYKSSAEAPWAKYRGDITKVWIEGSITYVGDYAFADLPKCEEIEFDFDAPKFGKNVFLNTSATATYYSNRAGWDEAVLDNYGGEIEWVIINVGKIIASGSCGQDMIWELTERDTISLSIYGEGKMYDYTSPDDVPWAEYRDSIDEINVYNGVEYIGRNALSNLPESCLVYFLCNAPIFNELAFAGSTVEAYCYSNTYGWDYDVFQGYGGEITYIYVYLVKAQGECGDGALWVLYDDNKLVIYGEGGTYDFASSDELPWAKYRGAITEVVVAEGITYIGANAFADLYEVYDITFEGDAPKFSESAFKNTAASVNYYSNTEGWDDDILLNYGGELEWCCYYRYSALDSGECGDGVFWIVYDDGELDIYGEGKMNDYASPDEVPWAEYRDTVEYIWTSEGITHIGDYAFSEMPDGCIVYFAGDAPTFGANAFKGTTAMAFYYIGYEGWDDGVMQNYGGNITWVSSYAYRIIAEGECGDGVYWELYDYGEMDIYGEGDMYDYASPAEVPWAEYADLIQQIYIYDDITRIGNYAFSNLPLPATEINFYGDAPKIGENAFSGTTATAFYFYEKDGWNDEVFKDYGGDIWWEMMYMSNTIAGGELGEDISWDLYVDGTLSIYGYGDTYDYESALDVPWAEYLDYIDYVYFEGEIKHIGNFVLGGLKQYITVDLGESAPTFGENAFAGTIGYVHVDQNNGYWTDEYMQHYGGYMTWIEEFSGPCGENAGYLFESTGYLIIYGYGDMEDYASAADVPWARFAKDIETIAIYESITHIGDYAFAGISNNPDVFFYGDAPTFGENAFSGTRATAICFPDTEGWSEDVLLDYGGRITWELAHTGALIAEGTCGEHIEWYLDDGGSMSMFVNGYVGDSIGDYQSADDLPWAEYLDMIKEIRVYDVTGFGDNVFAGLSDVDIYFDCNAPEFSEKTFAGSTVNAWYDADGWLWDNVANKNYGGNITWLRYNLRGDVNVDGNVTNADLILVARYVVELLEKDSYEEAMVLEYGDMNYDGIITNADIIKIARIIVGIEDPTEAEAAVFWYDFSDAFLSNVRNALSKDLSEAGIRFENFNARCSQAVQMGQIDSMISQGVKLLIVNIVDTSVSEYALTICNHAKAAGIPVIFFNRDVPDSVINSYDQACYVGTRVEDEGDLQGQMIGQYVVDNFDAIDLNKDGKISYILMKGELGNPTAEARTKYSVEKCNSILKAAGKPELVYYDPNNTDMFQPSNWSKTTAFNIMVGALGTNPMDGQNPIELVITNNDDAAMGVIEALNIRGWNTGAGKSIPVFGVDYTIDARKAIALGRMTGSILEAPEGFADVVTALAKNVKDGKDVFSDTEGFDVDETCAKIYVPHEIKMR